MNKIGRYSTGLKGSPPKSAPFKDCNGGYEKRTNGMADFNAMEPRQKPRPTYAGAAADLTIKRKP